MAETPSIAIGLILDRQLKDVLVAEGATEFTVPRLGLYGVVDLPAVK